MNHIKGGRTIKKIFSFLLTLFLSAALLAPVSAGTQAGNVSALRARQDEVHAAAELLRALGIPEDDPAILALQEEWWRCQARLRPCFTEEEVTMVAKTIWGEARGVGSLTEQACVAWTVCNHVDEPTMCAASIKEALLKPNRFYYRTSFPATRELLWLARDVLERWNMEKLGYAGPGRVLPSDYLYYSGDGKHNYFRNAYRGGSRWDYSLPSPYLT